MNWSDYQPYFYKSEFDCRETEENEMNPEFMQALLQLRKAYDKPMIITSGYRSPLHSIERQKPTPGEHALGMACDVKVAGHDAFEVVRLALQFGFTRIGVKQKGDWQSRFIHLGMSKKMPSPMIWSY